MFANTKINHTFALAIRKNLMLGSWVRAPSGSLKQKAKLNKALIIKHYQSFFF